jgi:DNA polymerase (family 10)
MPVHNVDIAAVFEEIADLLEIEGDNPFRIRAYRNAARTLRDLSREASSMLEKDEDLTDLPGIGKDLAAKIQDIVDTGTTPLLGKLRKQVPPALTELLHIPGLGPKRVKTLYHELDIHTVEQLHRAALDGRLHTLPGFGAKTEQRIVDAIRARSATISRFKLATAAQYADALVTYLQQAPAVTHVIVAGSYRRAKETIGDLDILVTTPIPSRVIDHFVRYGEVAEVIAHGSTRASVRLQSKLQVDLRVVPDESYGAALHYFTGSKAHNIAIRDLGQQRGLKINEYGVFREDQRIAGETEASVFATVGLPLIPPELRENRGEIEAARDGTLPHLIELSDLKGDLHAHTTATDGRNSLEEMALAARERGFEYLAITEHSRHLTIAHGLDEHRLLTQINEIDRLNEKLSGIILLKSIEVDILEDGELDLPDHVLARLDLVVVSIHSRMHLSRQKQTERILRAMDRPYVTILAHPTGRLIPEREPYDVDMPRIIHHARERGCFLELNAHPERMDLLDTYCRLAKQEGVLVSVNSDAHSVLDFNNLRFGIGQARRGWLEKDNVLNTRPLRALLPLLQRT